jgi:hypothetical protein
LGIHKQKRGLPRDDRLLRRLDYTTGNPTVLVPAEAGTNCVERSEQSAFREAQYAGSRDDHVIE